MEICGQLWSISSPGLARRESRVPTGAHVGSQTLSALMVMRACSACAGDYEDPDRTAGEEFEAMLAGEDRDEEEIEVEE